jgi:hypothetical protein
MEWWSGGVMEGWSDGERASRSQVSVRVLLKIDNEDEDDNEEYGLRGAPIL